METAVSSDLSLRPDPATSIHHSATADATSDATSHATPMSHDIPESPVTTALEPRFPDATSGETCRTDASAVRMDDHPMLRLTPKQLQALELLGAGAMDKSVCKRLNIHRSTLSRWKTTHPRFMAELARRTTLRQQSSNTAACRARDAALKIVLKQLRTQPNRSLDIAVRLLCSPQLARLASSSRPASLQQTITQLQSTRPSPAVLHDSIPDLLQQLDAELDSPEPEPLPPKPVLPTFQKICSATKTRSPRPDLLAALAPHASTDNFFAHEVLRRPDLLPFDIHYYNATRPYGTAGVDLVKQLTQYGPAGLAEPLSPDRLARMIENGCLPRIAALRLDAATATFTPDHLVVTTSDGQKHTFQRHLLWRDFVLGWSCDAQAASA